MASVVAAAVVAGVYAVFSQSVTVQVQSALRMSNQQTAQAILSEFSQAIENVITQPSASSIKAGPQLPDGAYVICMISPPRHSIGKTATVAERRRYSWSQREDGNGMFLGLQRMPFVGPKCIHPLRRDEGQHLNELWPLIERETIASGFQSLSLKYRPANDPNAEWREDWQGDSDDVAVWISVVVGDETREAIVIPKVRTREMSEDQ